NSRRVLLKGGWSEPSVLWSAVVAHSGTGKSPALREMLRPVRDRDWELHEQTERDLQRHDLELAQWEADRKVFVAGKPVDLKAKPSNPPMRAILVEDVTAEALAERLLDNARGLILAVDELAGWLGSFNSYKRRDGDEQKWLQIHGAEQLKVDRK